MRANTSGPSLRAAAAFSCRPPPLCEPRRTTARMIDPIKPSREKPHQEKPFEVPYGPYDSVKPEVEMNRVPLRFGAWWTSLAIAAVLWAAATVARVSAQVAVSTEAAVHEGYAELPGARIFYRDTAGGGVPVVFLHAATGSSRVWESQIPAFSASGYRVIAYDRRGWGRTVIDPAGPQPGTGADDLLGLLNFLKVERVHLVGTAAGGFVALDFALSFPERLRSLVIANSIGGIQDQDFLELGRRLRPPQFDALPPEVRELGAAYRAAHAEGTKRWMDLEKIRRPA